MHIPVPIGSMYGIFTYIYNKNQPNAGIPYMDPMSIVLVYPLYTLSTTRFFHHS